MRRLILYVGLVLVLAAPVFGQTTFGGVATPFGLALTQQKPGLANLGLKAERAKLAMANGNRDGSLELMAMYKGTFWRDPDWVSRLSLQPEQVKKMEETFRTFRLKLIDVSAALEKDELLLTPLVEQLPGGDSAKLNAQIDKVADDRAELEKTNSKMYIAILQILTPAQWTKLRENKKD